MMTFATVLRLDPRQPWLPSLPSPLRAHTRGQGPRLHADHVVQNPEGLLPGRWAGFFGDSDAGQWVEWSCQPACSRLRTAFKIWPSMRRCSLKRPSSSVTRRCTGQRSASPHSANGQAATEHVTAHYLKTQSHAPQRRADASLQSQLQAQSCHASPLPRVRPHEPYNSHRFCPPTSWAPPL